MQYCHQTSSHAWASVLGEAKQILSERTKYDNREMDDVNMEDWEDRGRTMLRLNEK